MSQLSLIFTGPYYFTKSPNIFNLPAKYSAVYLWTVPQEDKKSALIHYIGETQDVRKRFFEHLQLIFSLNYGIFDNKALQKGELKIIWPGFWRTKLNFDPTKITAIYQELNKTITEYINLLEFYVSTPISDQRIRRNIEGHLAIYLKKTEYKGIYPPDTRTGISPQPLDIAVTIDFSYLKSRQVVGVAKNLRI